MRDPVEDAAGPALSLSSVAPASLCAVATADEILADFEKKDEPAVDAVSESPPAAEVDADAAETGAAEPDPSTADPAGVEPAPGGDAVAVETAKQVIERVVQVIFPEPLWVQSEPIQLWM